MRLELSVGDGVDTDRSRLAGRQMRGRRMASRVSCRPPRSAYGGARLTEHRERRRQRAKEAVGPPP